MVDLWCPLAKRVRPEFKTHGEYERGYPRGAVVHYTAGAYGDEELKLARDRGLSYFFISEHGVIYQGAPLNRWGSHAGESFWPGLGNSVSKSLVGIEVDCAGRLKPDGRGAVCTWWKQPIKFDDYRLINGIENGERLSDNRKPGFYHAFKYRQEQALTALLLWLKVNHPLVFSFDLVLGHDEVSPGRKTDPGGSLSTSMAEFRGILEQKYRDGR